MLGDNIEKIRKLRKISQKDLSDAIGMSTVGYQKAINRGDIKVSTLGKIADFLNVGIQTFFSVAEEPTVKGKSKVVFELESDDVLRLDMKNRRLEII